jgi:hypothetical protein
MKARIDYTGPITGVSGYEPVVGTWRVDKGRIAAPNQAILLRLQEYFLTCLASMSRLYAFLLGVFAKQYLKEGYITSLTELEWRSGLIDATDIVETAALSQNENATQNEPFWR